MNNDDYKNQTEKIELCAKMKEWWIESRPAPKTLLKQSFLEIVEIDN